MAVFHRAGIEAVIALGWMREVDLKARVRVANRHIGNCRAQSSEDPDVGRLPVVPRPTSVERTLKTDPPVLVSTGSSR